MINNMEQASNNLRRDWEVVGGYISDAMQEVAAELGGDELSGRIALEAISDGTLPNPTALKNLDELYPGSAERVITRASEVQREAHERELLELRKPSLRKYGRAMLDGVGSINLFGIPLSKNR